MKDLKNLYKNIYKNKYYKNINQSNLLSGLAIVLLNIFSKYVELEISKTQEEYIKNTIGRRVLIFTILYVGTRDLIISFLLTAAFIIMSSTIFNEKSKLCIIPEKYKKIEKIMDSNNDNYISDKEIESARKVLHKASIQQQKILLGNAA